MLGLFSFLIILTLLVCAQVSVGQKMGSDGGYSDLCEISLVR